MEPTELSHRDALTPAQWTMVLDWLLEWYQHKQSQINGRQDSEDESRVLVRTPGSEA